MPDEAPRLYLITPPLDETAAFAPRLEAALDAGDIACVLMRIADHARSEAKTIIRALTPLVQQRDIACLIVDDTQLAARTDTDGVHIEFNPQDDADADLERLHAALAAMQPRRIVGAGGIKSRDVAMLAGEAGADYLLFGALDGEEPLDALLERIAWWAEIFQIPCIGEAHRFDAIASLAQAGADFIALGRLVWNDPRGPAAAIAEAMEKRIVSSLSTP